MQGVAARCRPVSVLGGSSPNHGDKVEERLAHPGPLDQGGRHAQKHEAWRECMGAAGALILRESASAGRQRAGSGYACPSALPPPTTPTHQTHPVCHRR